MSLILIDENSVFRRDNDGSNTNLGLQDIKRKFKFSSYIYQGSIQQKRLLFHLKKWFRCLHFVYGEYEYGIVRKFLKSLIF